MGGEVWGGGGWWGGGGVVVGGVEGGGWGGGGSWWVVSCGKVKEVGWGGGWCMVHKGPEFLGLPFTRRSALRRSARQAPWPTWFA